MSDSYLFTYINPTFPYQTLLTQQDLVFRKQIGSGSFGKVYKINIKIDQKNYALKVLSKNQLKKLNLLPQLSNEISILSSCSHPNIISLYQVFETEGYIFMLMEFADQGTLYQKIQKNKKLTENDSINFIKDVIEAVSYLH